MSNPRAVVVSEKIGVTVDPLAVVQTLIEYGDKWVVEVQRARVERDGIAARESAQVERIHAQREVLLKALELTFDERRENFRRLFDGLDSALAAEDPSQVASFLESITDLAKSSPFQELANLEIVVSELKRPDQVWDV
jgi:hypothetical protein